MAATSLKDWKYPKIPIDQVYKKKVLGISSSYAVKDFEDTVTVNRNDKKATGCLLSVNFLKGFVKKQHKFLHLGLVQIAVKPLMRDGLGSPIVVSLRDARHRDFHDSLLALVKANLSQGPVYFECFPGFSVSLDDDSLFEVLTLDVETGGVPLALTYRVVCKAMVDLSPEALKEPILGETPYFQPATGTRGTTKWVESELQAHESSTSEQELKSDDRVLGKGCSIETKLANEEGSSQNKKSLDDWKYPKIPVNQVYDKSYHNMISPADIFLAPSLWSKARQLLLKNSSTVKEYEKIVTLKANKLMNTVSIELLKGLGRKKKGFVHMGLFQIAIKPLLNDDGLEGAPIIACVRDTAARKFEKSLFALVQANLCEGPFYFNCCPGFSIASDNGYKFIKLYVKSCVPLELAFRLVCNVTTNVTLDYRKQIHGETICYHPVTGTECTTKWDEVQVPESWTLS